MNGLGKHLTRLVVTCALAAGALACRTEVPSLPSITTRDSSGVVIVTVPGAALAASADVQALEPVLTLGADDSTGALFARVTGARFVIGGGTAVASDANKSITWFTKEGTRLGGIGRPGRGPGEFQHVQLIGTDGEHIVAHDAISRRLTIVDDPARTPDIVPLSRYGESHMIPVHLFADRRLLVRVPGRTPEPVAEGVVRSEDTLRIVAPDRGNVVELGVHPAADRVLRMRSSGSLTGGEPPYPRRLLVATRDTFVYAASTGAWETQQYHTDGRLLRVIRVQRPRRAITAAMRATYRAAVLDGVRDPYGIAEWTMLSADDVFPTEMPAIDAMLVDDRGVVWMRESAAMGDRDADWFGLDESGQPIAHVRLPAAFAPTHFQRGLAVGTYARPDGVQEIRVYAYR